MTAHYGPDNRPNHPERLSREDQEWVLASILSLPMDRRNYAAVILTTDDDEQRMIHNGARITPLNKLVLP